MVCINRSIENELMAKVINKRESKPCTEWSSAPSSFCVPNYGYPTEAPPGTVQKLLVFFARKERNEELFHPYDAKNDTCLMPLLFYLAIREGAIPVPLEKDNGC